MSRRQHPDRFCHREELKVTLKICLLSANCDSKQQQTIQESRQPRGQWASALQEAGQRGRYTHLASSFPCFSIAFLRSTSLAQKRHLLGGGSWQRWGSMCFSPVGRPAHHEYTVCVHGGGLDRLHLRHARCFLLLHSSATSSEHGGATGALHIRCI